MIAARLAACVAACAPRRLERSAARDEVLGRVEALAGGEGWTMRTLRAAGGPDADLLFPGGPAEMVEAWLDRADRAMIEVAHDLDEPRLSRRVRAIILMRLRTITPDRAAMRRALAVLMLPGRAGALARSLARTVDAIWEAAGDRSGGLSRQTKRMTLASVYVQTLLFWLARGDDPDAVASFLDRRLEAVARIGRIRQRLAAGRAA